MRGAIQCGPRAVMERPDASLFRWPGTAVGEADGLTAGLKRYHLFHATRTDLLRATGHPNEAGATDRLALRLTANPAERRLARPRGLLIPESVQMCGQRKVRLRHFAHQRTPPTCENEPCDTNRPVRTLSSAPSFCVGSCRGHIQHPHSCPWPDRRPRPSCVFGHGVGDPQFAATGHDPGVGQPRVGGHPGQAGILQPLPAPCGSHRVDSEYFADKRPRGSGMNLQHVHNGAVELTSQRRRSDVSQRWGEEPGFAGRASGSSAAGGS